MTRDDEFIGQLEGYLDEYEGATPLPELVRDAIRAQLPSIQQRPAWWPARRFPDMNNSVRLAIAAAAVAGVAIIGISFFGGPNVGGPGVVAVSPSATPMASPTTLVEGDLEAGTYVTHPSAFAADPIGVTVTVPDGWSALDRVTLVPAGRNSTNGPDGMALAILDVETLYSDPCHGTSLSDEAGDLVVGPTVDDLVTALADHPAWEASEPTNVTLGGYAGERIDLQLPSDVASCDRGQFLPWYAYPYAQGADNRWHVWVIDVEGTRVVVLAEDFPGTPAADRAELMAIVDSIQFSVVR